MMQWIRNEPGMKLEQQLGQFIKQSSRVWLISPFVTANGIRILNAFTSKGQDCRLITRLNDEDVLSRVVNPNAIAEFQDAGGVARFHAKNLHTKLWLFDDVAAIGSANLTEPALSSNIEMMSVIPIDSIQPPILSEYERLWNELAGTEQSSGQLREYAKRLSVHHLKRRFDRSILTDLKDYGRDLSAANSKQQVNPSYWIKINGLSNSPIGLDFDFRRIAHYEGGQTFPGSGQGGRYGPSVKAGDHFILARLGARNGESDYCIYGRGIVDIEHRSSIDEPPEYLQEVLSVEKWNHIRRWPYIVWLRNVQIVNGFSSDCPWIRNISFHSTNPVKPGRWAQTGRKELQEDQFNVLSHALDEAFRTHGSIDMSVPDDIWWNREIDQEEYRVTRTSLELRLGMP